MERRRPDGVAAPIASTTRRPMPSFDDRPRPEENGPPAMVRRELVPGVRPQDEVGNAESRTRLRRSPFFLPRWRSSRSSRPSRHEDDFRAVAATAGSSTASRPHAEVHLAADVRVEVEWLPLHEFRERIGAGGDSLRLEHLRQPRERHLTGDDALDVALEGDDVHHAEELALGDELELAAVEGGRRD